MRIAVGLTIALFVGILAVTWVYAERAHPKFIQVTEGPHTGHH
jgi:hypothetical protein